MTGSPIAVPAGTTTGSRATTVYPVPSLLGVITSVNAAVPGMEVGMTATMLIGRVSGFRNVNVTVNSSLIVTTLLLTSSERTGTTGGGGGSPSARHASIDGT